MAQPEYTPYLDALTEAMKLTMEDDKTIFIGQQIVYYGNPMSKTIEGLPKERMIETPVMEEVQMGMSLGLGMAVNPALGIPGALLGAFLGSKVNQMGPSGSFYEGLTDEQKKLYKQMKEEARTREFDPNA